MHHERLTWSIAIIVVNPLAFLLVRQQNTNISIRTFFKIPLTLIAPLRSVLVMNRGLFHLIVLPSSETFRSHSGSPAPLLHFVPFPTMNSSLGSPGRFLLTLIIVDCKLTVLNPWFFLVLASVNDFNSFCESELRGGVAGLVGRAGGSIWISDIFPTVDATSF